MHLCGIFLNTAFPWPVEAMCPVMYEFKVVHNSGFFFYFDTVRDAVNQSKIETISCLIGKRLTLFTAKKLFTELT